MNAGETVYLGPNLYLHFTGTAFELREGSPTAPSEVVYFDDGLARSLVDQLMDTLDKDE